MSHQYHPDFEQMVAERAAGLHQHILALPADQQATFQSDPKALPAAIEAYARENRVPMLFGPAKMAQAAAALAAMPVPPRILVEFGAYVGYSALRWVTLLEEVNKGGGDADVHVYTFELDPAKAQIARDFAKAAGRASQITVLEGPGDVSLSKLVTDGVLPPGSVDVVFIDHWEPRYKPDLQLCESLGVLRVGSLIVADNTDYPGAPDYVAYVKNGGSGEPGAIKFETTSYDADTAPEPPQKRIGGRFGGPGRPGGGGFGGSPSKIVEVTKVVSLGS
ncbi:hypothetical protein SPBR_03071 [Sporothrix brasiliensis 5110]|uniref:catechol O-methyltransferase n=1 Tax=Sporothrix brasiliensis 5110 TaxID=1398154 RepID=A0A0C2J063_9PEZI|nr:uncharacterized protein SPBR_03071 [Sporothrix brasiliensis 5110]KIH92385.1 hypothetical protein SPBR_03071 [Sporothrix brasiliensis 5110]